MYKIDKLSRIILSVAALFLVWTANTNAASLYERSLEKFQVGIEHVSPADFTFVVLGDNRGNDGIFKKALALAKSYNPLFILHGGDYSDNGVKFAFYFHVHLYDRDEIKGVPSIITAGAGAPLVSFGFPGEPVYHIVLVRVKNGAVTTEMVKVQE